MNLPLTRTKILLPRRPLNLLTRQRLLDLLYELSDYRLVIIAAPAGYGKTSLLLDFAHHVEMPVCWYALDPLDQDPPRFAAHLIGAIAERFTGFGRQSAAALQNSTSPSLNVDQVVSSIANEASEQIRERFALVLDDYHLIGNCETANRFISQFVQNMNGNCHLLLSSRSLLTLPDLPLMVARSQVGGLDLAELSFHADEIQALMLQNYNLAIPDSEAQRLVEETEGWITGLLLSAHTMWQGMADRARLARVSGVGLYDYLAQQVLDQQPAPVRDFLLRTSPLEEFDAALCSAVLGLGQDWQCMMDSVLRSNLFVLPVDNGRIWLRYHHLFRDFLQDCLAREQPEELDHLMRRMASIFAQREEWAKAYAICKRLDDITVTADLIEQSGSSMVKNGRWITLADWLDALPAEVLSSRAALLSLRGYVGVLLGAVENGIALLNRAEVALRTAIDVSCLARTLVRRATAHRFQGNYPASLSDADAALTLAAEDKCQDGVRAEALKEKGLNSLRMGQLNEAIKWLEQSLAVYSSLSDQQNVATLSMDLGAGNARLGHHARALTCYQRALEYWRTTGNISQQANLLNNLGVLYQLKGDYTEAIDVLEEALDCARRTGYARIEALALSSIGDLYAELDAPKSALEAYRQSQEIARRIDYRFLVFYLKLHEAALSRSEGHLSQARVLLDSAHHSAQSSHSNYELDLWRLEAGRVALAEKEAPQAIEHLEEAARHFQEGGQRVEAVRAHVYLAVALHASHKKRAALASLERCFTLAFDMDCQHTMVTASREAKPLLETAQSDSEIGTRAVQLLDEVFRFEQNMPSLRRYVRQKATSVPFAPPTLTLRALGRVEVMVGERKITGADWQAQVARDLLFCLLAHPEGLTREAIGVIFWPESPPSQLKLQFKQTIYRLRRAVGHDIVVLDQDRYKFNWAMDYAYDIENFLAKLAEAQKATEPRERTMAYRAAADLYEGIYLPDIDELWVFSERERLWQAFVEAILASAEFHLAAGEYRTALGDCRRALAQDACLEQAHRLAIRAYAAIGDRAAVARQYEACRRALLKEANASLSPQTEALYAQLMRG